MESNGTTGRDNGLLDRYRMDFRCGNWLELTRLTKKQISRDAKRGKLATLIAGAHSCLGNHKEAQEFSSLALEWGCSRQEIGRILLAATCSSLAQLAKTLGQEKSADSHLESSVQLLLGPLTDHASNSDLTICKLELAAALARPSYGENLRPDMSNLVQRNGVDTPFTIVIAGVPRSGSTWVYNAIRLLCKHAGLSLHSAWHEDFQPQKHQDCAIHLVKLHTPDQLNFQYHRLITSNRNLLERMASLVRMGWVKTANEEIYKSTAGQVKLHAYWFERSHLEVAYQNIINNPVATISLIAKSVDISVPKTAISLIAKDLIHLPDNRSVSKSRKVDKTTLLHQNHISTIDEKTKFIDLVRSAIESHSKLY